MATSLARTCTRTTAHVSACEGSLKGLADVKQNRKEKKRGERAPQRAFGVNAAPSPPGSKASAGEPGAADEVKDAPSVPDSRPASFAGISKRWVLPCSMANHVRRQLPS